MNGAAGPSVLCIGAQKAGTTWLYRCLEQRPDVWLPPVKELHFFDEKITSDASWFDHMHGSDAPAARWKRQIASERQRRSRAKLDQAERERRAWCSRYFFEPQSVDWYRSLFPPGWVGMDTSPEYALLDAEGVDRTIAALPDVRVIYLLRNAIEREWSGAQMRFRKNPNRGPESVLEGSHPHSRYHENIDRWAAGLPPGRLYIGWFDDIAAHPGELLADILAFIGASTANISLPSGRPNSGNMTTIPALYAVALAKVFEAEFGVLAERFGGPAANWAETARVLRNSTPEGNLRYPLDHLGSTGPPSQISSLII